MKKIGIGGDHAGYDYKKRLIAKLESEGYEVTDFGPDSEASVDYPDYVHPLAIAVESGKLDLGIAVCGSGNGVCMTVNKHQGVRGAQMWNTKLAELARQHNNANIACIPARFVDYDLAEAMIHTFVTTDFEGGRHERRVDKISC
ncbi:MAG: RpiB/LacA/LacB family sugar-phosphate isomerase [Roseivirga sp.]|nr:RpiB/LacA/LacB family sugar-phosphate isomerase [Roseivirga sp.]